MSSPRSQFWDLHRRLGEIYQADVQHAATGADLRVPSHSLDLFSPLYRQTSSASQHSQHDLLTQRRPSIEQPGALYPEPPSSMPRTLGRVSLRSHSYGRSSTPEHEGILSGDREAEEKAMIKVKSGGKTTRFEPAREVQMVVPQTPEEESDTRSPETKRQGSFDVNHLRACWQLEIIDHSFHRRTSNLTGRSRSEFTTTSIESLDVKLNEVQRRQSQKGYFVIHPHTSFKICWDLLGMIFLMRDLFFIPLQLFNLPPDYELRWLDLTSLIFWTLDIFLSFFTGYYEKGRLELSQSRIAINYLKTWFFLDIIVVGIDWFFELQPSNGADGVARVTKSIRSARFLRMFRLIRLSKMSKVSLLLREQISSEGGTIYFRILLVILRMCVLQHVIACGWFGVGDLATDAEGRSWILTHGFRERTFPYQYSTCLHWAFAQLGMGSVEIESETTQERVFCICVAFIGLISFSTLVSTVTSLMSNLQKAQDQEQQLFRDLRRFLHDNDIPIDLSQRVTRFLQHAYRLHTSQSVDSEVAIFSLLSKSLNAELQFTRYKRCLFSLVLCKKMLLAEEEAQGFAQKLAVKTLTTLQLAQNDSVFQRGTVAHTCYFALESSLVYVVDKSSKTSVQEGSLIAEVALWTPWIYLGDLISKEMSRVVAIDVESFCACVAEMHEVQEQAIYLAQNIVEAMNDASSLNDLWTYDLEDGSVVSRELPTLADPLSPLMRLWDRVRESFAKKVSMESVVPTT